MADNAEPAIQPRTLVTGVNPDPLIVTGVNPDPLIAKGVQFSAPKGFSDCRF